MTQQPPPPDYGTQRLPPQNAEAEASLVGRLMVDPKAISAARATGLELEHFYDSRLGIIYQAALDLRYVEGEPVDQVTVAEHLKQHGKLDEVGGVVRLSTLASETQITSTVQIESHAQIILETSSGRAALEDAAELSSRIYAGEAANEVLVDVAGKLNRRQNGGLEEGWRSAGELLEQLDKQYNHAAALGGRWAGINSGIPELNDLTSGLCPEEFTLLGARPNLGKSTLLLRIATTVAEAGIQVAIFSMEMSKVQCMQRLACIEAGVDLRRFRSGRLDIDEMDRYKQAKVFLGRLPLFFDYTAGLEVAALQAKFDRLRDQQGAVPLVCIDFIQLMGQSDPRINEAQRFTDIAKGLQQFTKAEKVHTIAASQLSRGPEARDDHRPRVSDLRESGGLEQAADNVWLIHRPGYYPDLVKKMGKDGMSQEAIDRKAEIIVGKTRFGPTGIVRMDWLTSTGEFLVPGESAYSTPQQEEMF